MITISLFSCCEKVFTLMNVWMIGKKLSETSLPEKEYFCSHLNMESITDADYTHTERAFKDFVTENIRE